MQSVLLPQAERYIKRQKHHKLWKKIVGALACVVLLCTTYMLILPAITMERTSYCSTEAHQHSEACYEKRLICGFGETAGGVLTANPEHVHTNACYEVQQVLICEQTEMPGHVHDESCVQTKQVLICTEDHEHTDDCYQTMEVYICNLNEGEGAHVHGPECFEMQSVLTCGFTETEEVPATALELQTPLSGFHVHTDTCYEKILICKKSEHEHTLACFSNPESDVESRELWERTVAGVQLTGVWADDIVAIAQSQLGYVESTENYIVMDDGITIKGYTRYGAWWGDPYGDWAATFVSFCLNYANIPGTAFPYEAFCDRWVNILSKPDINLYRSRYEYIPSKGDIIFFDNDGDGICDHAGIVAAFTPDTAQIKIIEGDSANTVQYALYSADDFRIYGYSVFPKHENTMFPDVTDPEDDISAFENMFPDVTDPEDDIVAFENTLPDVTDSADDMSVYENDVLSDQEYAALPEITKSAVIYTDGKYETLFEDGTVITLTGVIPEDAQIRAFPVTVETQQLVICAYDICIFMPDGTLYEPAEGEKINVTIQVPELNADTTSDTTAYYIPEDSAPVPMDTSIQEDGTVCFETDHFSVYALMRSGKVTEVYLNGVTGNDNNAGTQAAPVKTFEKALSLLSENGTIYVSGTVTVNSAESWSIDVAGAKMQRATGFTGPLVTVVSGGSLTLSDLTMNGGCGTLPDLLINNNTSYSNTYATGSAKAPLIVVNSGGFLNVTNGTVLEYNSNKPNTYNDAFLENGYIGLGGAVYSNGTLTMTGGLIQNCEAQCGGGIYVENGSFHLSGGTIDHNYARNILGYAETAATYRKNAGGGVYVGNNSTMVMSGGTVSNNQSSREGGGISLGWLDRTHGKAIYSYTTTLNMTGGTFTGNKALSTGGGLNVTAGRAATVSAGYFTGNSAYGYDSQGDYYNGAYRVFSGGGIYVDAAQWDGYGNYAGVPGKLLLHRAVITGNSSDFQGGGIAACPTGISHINANLDLSNGTAIYNNTAAASVGANDEIGIKNIGSNDIITNHVLGGGDYNWTSSTSGEWTNFGNALTDNSPEIVDAKSLATVWITNNHGYLGGGIGNNGIIEVGGELEDTTVSITINKEWEDQYTDHPAYITVQVLQDGQPYGELIKIYKTTDSNGHEVWTTYYLDGLPAGHTYTIEEVTIPGYSSVVTQNGNNFTITNTRTGFWLIKKWVGDTAADRPGTIGVQLYQNGTPYGEPVQLTAANGWSYIWTNLPEKDADEVPYTYTAQEIAIPDGYYCTSSSYVSENGRWEITNTRIETTSVSAEKRWADGTTPTSSVTLQLKADGQAYGAPVTLSDENGWFYLWEDLPKFTEENVPDGTPISYTVTEINNTGYWATIVEGDANNAGPRWVEKTTLENGKTYLLVNANRALSAYSTSYNPNGLAWTDVSANLNNGTLPGGTALWTYSSTGSTMHNGDGKYLVPGYYISNNSYVYIFSSYNESRNRPVSVTNGLLTSSYFGSPVRYFTGSFDSHNYGSTTTSSSPSSAAIIKLYTLENSTANWGDTHYIVTNESAQGSIEIHFSKYSVSNDGGDPVLIAGADLALYRQEEAGTLIPGTEVTGTLVNQWTSGSAGSIQIENLGEGTYYLVETKAPEGHVGLAGPIIFTVDPANGQVIVSQYPGYPSMEGSNLFSGGNADLPIYNSSAYTLPETGGSGTTLYTAGGLLLMTSAILLLYIHKKRRKEDFTTS
ncbi:MAG: Cna B-type domain-containing protein [Eubacteriales bacterium]|jgi:LPXTG-motif cell wall-anchored protein